jgi:hypothetical protein
MMNGRLHNIKLIIAGNYRELGWGSYKIAAAATLEALLAALAIPILPFLFFGLLAAPGRVLKRLGYTPPQSRFKRILALPLEPVRLFSFAFFYVALPLIVCCTSLLCYNSFPTLLLGLPILIYVVSRRNVMWPIKLFLCGAFAGVPLLAHYNQFTANDYRAISEHRFVEPLLINDPDSPFYAAGKLNGKPLLVREMQISPDGKYLFATNFDQMDRSTHTVMPAVLKIDLTTEPVQTEYVDYTYSQEMAYDSRRDLLYVAGHSADKLAALSVFPFAVSRETEVIDKPHNLVYDEVDDLLYVVYESSYCQIFDPGTLQKVGDVPSSAFLMAPFDPILDRERNLLAVASGTPGYQLGLLDLSGGGNSKFKTFGLGSYGIAEMPGTDSYVSTDVFLGLLVELDRQTLDVKRMKYIGGGPRKLLYDSKRNLLYVSRFFRHELAVIDAEDWRIIAEVPVGYNVRGMRLTPQGRLFVGSAAGIVEIDVDPLLAYTELIK